MFSGSDQSPGKHTGFCICFVFNKCHSSRNTILPGHAGELQSAGIVKEKSA